jgi:hypothetical protein
MKQNTGIAEGARVMLANGLGAENIVWQTLINLYV